MGAASAEGERTYLICLLSETAVTSEQFNFRFVAQGAFQGADTHFQMPTRAATCPDGRTCRRLVMVGVTKLGWEIVRR